MIVFLILFLMIASTAEAVTYYVAKAAQGGSNANPCSGAGGNNAQNIAFPKLTIQGAKACWTAGDTIEIRAGTYNEIVDYGDWPSGTSWANTTKVKNYNGETVIIHITDSGNQTFGVYQAGAQYISFDGLTINQTFTNGNGAGFIELKNSIVRNSSETGITGTSDNRYTNNTVHNNGTHSISGIPQDHGFYIAGSNNTITNNTVYSNCGAGIHFNSDERIMSTNIVAFNRVYNNGTCGGSAQIVFTNTKWSGTNNEIYGNVVYSPINASYGIYLSGLASTTKVYNNTVYNSGAASGIISIGSGGTFRNNIVSANSPNLELSGSVTASNNLCGTLSGTSPCETGTSNRTEAAATATFNNAATNDFTLRATSLALNNGTTTGNPAGNTVDIANLARPQGAAFDIGAYERAVTPTCPAISPALVASYTFEGNANDITGNGRTATLGSGWSYTASGKVGQGALSTGASGITVADHDSLDPCAAFTYEGWINLPNTTGDYAFIVKNPDSKAFLFASINGVCGSGRPMGGFSETTGPLACYSGGSLATGFQHLAVTYDSTLGSANLKLYLNGVQVSSANTTELLSATTGTLQFCTSGFGETCPSGTVIDEIRIYNYPRSAAEIAGSVTSPPVFTIKLDVSSIKIGPSVGLKVGVP